MFELRRSVLLRPQPLWASSLALLPDDHIALADPVTQTLWVYEHNGAGRRVKDVWARRVGRAAGGPLWVEDSIWGLLELGQDFTSRRRTRTGRRWNATGLELVGLDCWLVEPGSRSLVGVGQTARELAIVRVPVDRERDYEVRADLSTVRATRNLWWLGLPYLGVEGERPVVAEARPDNVEVVDAFTGTTMARVAGGLRVTRPSIEWDPVAQWAQLSFAGLVSDGERCWALRREEGFFLLERVGGDVEVAVRSDAVRMIGAVVDKRAVLLELGVPGASGAGRLLELIECEPSECWMSELLRRLPALEKRDVPRPCPSLGHLEQLGGGSLGDGEPSVLGHVAACARCRAIWLAIAQEERE